MTDYHRKGDRSYGNSDDEKYNLYDDDKPHTKNDEYMQRLLAEKLLIDPNKCPLAYRYISEEIDKVQQKLSKGPPRGNRLIDLYSKAPIKVSVKVLFPVREFPRFNFVGKLLGQKGSTLKQLQEETKCYMNISGRGSMRDAVKEEELRKSLDPKYAHLTDDLHVEISTIAAPAEAHARVSNALDKIHEYLVPSFSKLEESTTGPKSSIFGKLIHQRSDGGEEEEEENSRDGPRGPRPLLRPSTTSKSSVMSILERARISIEESHNILNKRRQPREQEYGDYPKDKYDIRQRPDERGAFG